MRSEQRIKSADIDELEGVAETFENLSDGIITKRQAWAYFLNVVRDLPGQEVGEIMNVEPSTVYSLSNKGAGKFMRIKITAKAMEDDDWWLYG